jgi:hypothetical protein
MNNIESRFGENDRPGEGEEPRDIGLTGRKSKSPEKSLKNMMDALAENSSEAKPDVRKNKGETPSDEESLRQKMDELTEKSKNIQENDRKEAEELSKNLKEQMGEGPKA